MKTTLKLARLGLVCIALFAARTDAAEFNADAVFHYHSYFQRWSPTVSVSSVVNTNGGAWPAAQTGTWYYALAATNDLGRTTIGPVATNTVTATGTLVRIMWSPQGGVDGYLLWRGMVATNLTQMLAVGQVTSVYDYGTNAWVTNSPSNTVSFSPRIFMEAGHVATGANEVITKSQFETATLQTNAFTNMAGSHYVRVNTNADTFGKSGTITLTNVVVRVDPGAYILITTNWTTNGVMEILISATSVVDLASAQTISGTKTFSGTPKFTGGPTAGVFRAYQFQTLGNSQGNYATNATAFGVANSASATGSTIAGGASNVIDAAATLATIGGGSGNTNSGLWATISAGHANLASAEAAAVGGGYWNRAEGLYTVVSGGKSNTATAGTIGGGIGNNSSGGTISGGSRNQASGASSAIAGGVENNASGTEAAIGGGYQNIATKADTTVAGGGLNSATGIYSTVGGGVQNVAGNQYATVPGGFSNSALESFSFAAGKHAKAIHTGTFVWADASAGDFSSTNKNSFRARATGGVQLETAGAGLHVDGKRVFVPTNAYVVLFVDGSTNIVPVAPGANGSSLISSGPSGTPGFGVPIVAVSNVTLDALLDIVATNTGAGFIMVWDPATTNWVTMQTTNALAAADILTLVLQVDGPGSGLNADSLDGYSSAAFALLAGADFSGPARASSRFSSANAGRATLTGGVCIVTLPVAMTDTTYSVSATYYGTPGSVGTSLVVAALATNVFTVNGWQTNEFLWSVTDY